MSPHKHKFSVDAACGGCGVMLSELVTDQQQQIRDLATALAASAAKEPSMNVAQEIYELKRERDALTAKLEASERALERVREAWAIHRCPVVEGRLGGTFCPVHRQYHCTKIDDALTSPEARATGEPA